ncbi:MAG: SoxR reducing system RseC family protein [Clostridiaceae bacterium]
MKETGFVKEIDGEIAYIVFKRKSGCGDNCGHCSGSCPAEFTIVNVKNALGASIGDQVEVSMEEKYLYKITLLVYGFPLFMLILGVFLGIKWFYGLGYKNYEFFAAFSGLLLMGISYFIISRIDKKLSKNNNYSANMIRILEHRENSKNI